MAETLHVQNREPKGKRHARRLRGAGLIPANLYGHGQANLALSVKSDEIETAVRHGARVVDLSGAVKEKAFIRELQWDVYGTEVLHLDMTRVSADERLKITVNVELRGQAEGAKDGGIVQHVVHDVEIECLVTDIPEKLILRIGTLKLNESLSAAAIELPPGAKLVSDPDEVVVNCVPAAAEEELSGMTTEGAEPEVIGRKAEEEEEAEE